MTVSGSGRYFTMSGALHRSLGEPSAVGIKINYVKRALAIVSSAEPGANDWMVCPIGKTGSYRVSSSAAVEFIWSKLGKKRFLIPASVGPARATIYLDHAQELPGRRNKPRPQYPE